MEQFADRTKFNSISLVGTKELKDDMKPSAFVTAVKKFVGKVSRDHLLLFGATGRIGCVHHLAAICRRRAVRRRHVLLVPNRILDS